MNQPIQDIPAELEFDLTECMRALKYDIWDYEERDNLILMVNTQLAVDRGWKIIPSLNLFEVFTPQGFKINSSNHGLFSWEYIHKVMPDYWRDTTDAMSLFSDTKNVRLQIRPMGFDGQWKVGYEIISNVYLPGSGSYYNLSEAIVRAYVAYKNDPTMVTADK